MRKIVVLLSLFCSLHVSQASAESLEESFARLCGQVGNTQSLAPEELKGLVAECDRLLEAFRERNENKDKVYLMRLQQCRNFYDYMAEVKEKPSR